MSYILLTLYLVIFCLIIIKSNFFKSDKLPTKWVVIIFLSKFAGGLILWAIYAIGSYSRVKCDIFNYFDDGNIIFSSIHQNVFDYLKMVTGIGANDPTLMKYYETCNFWIKPFNYGFINDNRIVIRFNAIVRLFSMGNIHIHTLFISFLSFVGLWNIYKVFEGKIKTYSILLVGFIFYIPSTFLWTSGLLKEGILMFAFGTMFYQFDKIISNSFSAKNIIYLLTSVFLLLLSKFYVFVAALPGLLFLIIYKFSKRKNIAISLIISHLSLFLAFWFSKYIIGLNLPQALAHKQNDFIAYANSLTHVDSLIYLTPLKPTFMSFLTNIPQALINSFFRPHIFEIKNHLMLMSATENVFILLLLVLFIIFFKKNFKDPFLWFSISFVLILFTLIGLTTPVLGALVRYKAPALPFLGMIILYLTDVDKIKDKMLKIKRW